MLFQLGYTWNCDHCHEKEYQIDHFGKSWGYFNGDGRYLKCEGCKEMCDKDKECKGVQCYGETSNSMSARHGLASCQWMKINSSEECAETNTNYFTCWKEYTRKLFSCQTQIL